MANVQDIKAQKAEKTLRLFTILLLIVGIVAFAASITDLVTKHMLLKLFGAKENAGQTNFSGISASELFLTTSGALLIIGTIMHLVKGNYRTFQGTCIAAIIFAVFPLIIFAVNIGGFPFAAIFAALALAIIVLAIIAMKSRWQVYIKEMTGEVKKLTWLTMKELIKATAVVLVFVLAFALLIYVLDLIFYTPVKLLLTGNETETTATAEPVQDGTTATAEPVQDGTTAGQIDQTGDSTDNNE